MGEFSEVNKTSRAKRVIRFILSVYMILDRARLDALYRQWNRPEYISPDPLETLSGYTNASDREIAGLIASALAYGRVNALLVPLRRVLSVMGASPLLYVVQTPQEQIESDLSGIVHRFAGPSRIAALLAGAGSVIRDYGSLEAAFLSGYRPGSSGGQPGQTGADRFDDTAVVAGLNSLVSSLRRGIQGDPGHLLADPSRGSACKRLLLFLRWMVRRDAVDPGGWDSVDPAHLLLPLDTWTHRIALRAGWTKRKAADMRSVREVSAALAAINPDDPVRYDFALSRFGIRSELNLEKLFAVNAPNA